MNAGEKLENPWERLSLPAPGPAAAIGRYSAGCLSGGRSLPPDGAGYQVMRLSRGRFYGHPVLVDFIQELGRSIQKQKLGVLLVGDLGMARGGPVLSGHSSHQTGLDVDLWYSQPSAARKRSLRLDERETLWARSVVRADGRTLDPEFWSFRQEEIVRLAAEHPLVARIFVHPAVKRRFCDQKGKEASTAGWLRKLRPWWGHDDHFHVRLQCPTGSPNCQNQPSPPAGDGCDETLEWWFSEEAKEIARDRALEAKQEPKEPPRLPRLPSACNQLLEI